MYTIYIFIRYLHPAILSITNKIPQAIDGFRPTLLIQVETAALIPWHRQIVTTSFFVLLFSKH